MRILRATAGALVLALALDGCGGSGGGGAKSVSADVIVAAAAKSARAGSVEADFKMSGAGTKGSGSGVFNTGESRSGQLSLKVALAGREVQIDSIVSRNVLYMRSPAFSQLGQLGPGKEWVKLDLGQLAQQRGIDLSSLANTSPTPASALVYLRGSSHVENVGSDEIRGVSTTHYRVIVDLGRAAAKSTRSTQQALRRVIEATGAKRLPIDVWVDESGYVRKMAYAQGSGNGRAVKITMELHDFGAPVQVKPPPAGSVIDLQKALGG